MANLRLYLCCNMYNVLLKGSAGFDDCQFEGATWRLGTAFHQDNNERLYFHPALSAFEIKFYWHTAHSFLHCLCTPRAELISHNRDHRPEKPKIRGLLATALDRVRE